MAARNGIVIATVLAVAGSVARADTFDVTRFDDPPGPCTPGNCSLRQAVAAANATPGPDTITLHAGTYRLKRQGGDGAEYLVVTTPVTVEGDPGGLTVIDVKKLKARAFDVVPTGDFTLRHVTIRGGKMPRNGGAIFSEGRLTVENATFTKNKAADSGGAIATAGGTCTLTDVLIARNKAGNHGGGCSFGAGGTATLTRVTITGNKASDTGGGVDQDDGVDLTVRDSTVAGNKSKHEGGGLDLGSGTTTLTNVTISGNKSAVGGGVQLEAGGTVFVTHVTITGNKAGSGGGVWVDTGTTASLRATIVAKNKPLDCFGALDSRGFNLIGRTDGCTISGDTTGNLTGGSTPFDPLLGPLRLSGGATSTHALLDGSPAIDAVTSGCPPPSTDQRGVLRAVPCDIGAFEVQ